MNTPLLYLLAVLIWGPTYYVVGFQLGTVDPGLSVAYRFMLSGTLLLLFCRLTGVSLHFSITQHLWLLLQGGLLFGVNYDLMYQSSTQLSSGLIALTFSSIVLVNVVNSAIFLKTPISRQVLIGGLMGLMGVAMVFMPGQGMALSVLIGQALILMLVSVYCESLGNIVSARNQKKEIPVLQGNAFSMFYGGSVMLVLSVVSGVPLVFDFSPEYLWSLAYLTLFGTIIGFGCYLTLVGRIGAGKAAYITLLVPVVALLVSTVFEGYQWSLLSIAGALLVLLGNLIALIPAENITRLRQRLVKTPQRAV